ncbi:hypothetical protein BH11ACT3_BH11ACT3_10170 [soil metagenome]
MTSLRRSLLILPALASIALLAACGTTGAGTGGSGGGSDGGSSGGDGGSSAAGCDSYDTEYAPFTSPLVLSAPESGATFGDGSALVFELDPSLSEEVPQAALLDNVIGGSVRDAGPAFLTEDPDNTFTSTDNVFDSDLDGSSGIVRLTMITDVDYDGAVRNGSEVILGQYCITYKTTE